MSGLLEQNARGWGTYKQQGFVSYGSGGRKSEVRVQADWVSGEASSSCCSDGRLLAVSSQGLALCTRSPCLCVQTSCS